MIDCAKLIDCMIDCAFMRSLETPTAWTPFSIAVVMPSKSSMQDMAVELPALRLYSDYQLINHIYHIMCKVFSKLLENLERIHTGL